MNDQFYLYYYVEISAITHQPGRLKIYFQNCPSTFRVHDMSVHEVLPPWRNEPGLKIFVTNDDLKVLVDLNILPTLESLYRAHADGIRGGHILW